MKTESQNSDDLTNALLRGMATAMLADPNLASQFRVLVREAVCDVISLPSQLEPDAPAIRYWSTDDVQHELGGVSRSSCDRLRRRGLLRATGRGRSNLYCRYEVDGLSELLNARCTTYQDQPEENTRAMRAVLDEHIAECLALERAEGGVLTVYRIRALMQDRIASMALPRIASRSGAPLARHKMGGP